MSLRLLEDKPQELRLLKSFGDITKDFEGFMPDIYKDTVGKRSIGYGFNLDEPFISKLVPPDVSLGKRPISRQEADSVFSVLYSKAKKDAINYFGEDKFKKLPPEIQETITDMSYNLGANRLSGFKKFKSALREGDTQKAAAELKNSKWFNQVGRRSKYHYETLKKTPKLDLSFLNIFQPKEAFAGEEAPSLITPREKVIPEIRAQRPEEKRFLRPLTDEEKAAAVVDLTFKERGEQVPRGLRLLRGIESPEAQAVTQAALAPEYTVLQGIRGAIDKTGGYQLIDRIKRGVLASEDTKRFYEYIPKAETLPRWAKITANIGEDIIALGGMGLGRMALRKELLTRNISRKIETASEQFANEGMKNFLPAGYKAEEVLKAELKGEFKNRLLARAVAPEVEWGVEGTLGKFTGEVKPSMLQNYAKRQSFLKLVGDELKSMGEAGEISLFRKGDVVKLKRGSFEQGVLNAVVKSIEGDNAIVEVAGKQLPVALSKLTYGEKIDREIPEQITKWMDKGITIANRGAPIRITQNEAQIKDISGKVVDLPKGHEMTPFKLSNGKIWLHDGKDVVVESGQLTNLENKNLVLEQGKFDMPEGIEEVVKGGGLKELPAFSKVPGYSGVGEGEATNIGSFSIDIKKVGSKYLGNVYSPYENDAVLSVTGNTKEDVKAKLLTSINSNEKLMKDANISKTKFSQYQLPGGENYREVLIKAPYQDDPNSLDRNRKDVFQSSHWEEPNVISHARINDRTTPDGKKVLFIEEIQSDWARKFRKEGAIEPRSNQPRVREDENVWVVYLEPTIFVDVPKNRASNQQQAVEYAITHSGLTKHNAVPKGVPSHPLLKNWQEFTLKQLVKKAVEGGYDYISWTTSEQQAERYDLAKQIDKLFYNPDTKVLGGFRRGESIISETVEPKDLEKYIGKEPAKKILEVPKNKDGEHYLSGQDLKVGGEWAKNLYDKQIPNILKDLTKGEVESVNIKTPSKQSAETALEKRQAKFSTLSQSALKITPELKARVIGQPMAGGKEVKPIRSGKKVLKEAKKEPQWKVGEKFIKPRLKKAAIGRVGKEIKIQETPSSISKEDLTPEVMNKLFITEKQIATKRVLEGKSIKQTAKELSETPEDVIKEEGYLAERIPKLKLELEETKRTAEEKMVQEFEAEMAAETDETKKALKGYLAGKLKPELASQGEYADLKHLKWLFAKEGMPAVTPDEMVGELQDMGFQVDTDEDVRGIINSYFGEEIWDKAQRAVAGAEKKATDKLKASANKTPSERKKIADEMRLGKLKVIAEQLTKLADIAPKLITQKQIAYIHILKDKQFLTDQQYARLKKVFTGKTSLRVTTPTGQLKKKPMMQEEGRELAKGISLIVPRKPVITGQPPIIPRTKSLVLSEWNQPFKDLTEFQASPVSGLDPLRASELVDGKSYGAVRKFIVEPAREAERRWKLELKDTLDTLTKVSKGMRSKSELSKLTFKFIEKTLNPKEEKKITPLIKNTAEYLRKTYDGLLVRINEKRALLKRVPILKRQDYITHIQELSLLDEFFQGLSNVPDDMVNIPAFSKSNSPFFRFALQRLGGMEFELDAIAAFESYISRAYPIIYNTDVLKSARPLVERLPSNAYKYFSQYLDETMALRPTQADKLVPKSLLKGISWLRVKMGKGAILGNMATVFNQLFTLPNSMAAIGPRWIASATLKSHRNEWRAFTEKYSKVLQSRIFEIDFDPTLLSKVDKTLGFLLQWSDKEMVRIAWGAQFEKSLSKGVAFEKAIREADDMAFRTQSGFNVTDLPPAFRSRIASSFLQFQNTVNNGLNFLRFDLGKEGQEKGKWRVFKAALMWLGTLLVLNRIYREFGIPTPVDEWTDVFPLISMAEYGTPATYSLPTSVLQVTLAKTPQDRNKALKALRRAAFLFLPAGNQIRKSLEGIYAASRGGKFDKRGRLQFPIRGFAEKTRSVLFGPYGTKAGQRYIKKGFIAPKSGGLRLLR
jgi:GH24 family phage-related lysozyme (muramidase)